MDNVIVSVSDLLKKVEELHKDGMEYVELSVLEPEEEDLPVSLWFEAYKSPMLDMGVDYEGIDVIEDLDK